MADRTDDICFTQAISVCHRACWRHPELPFCPACLIHRKLQDSQVKKCDCIDCAALEKKIKLSDMGDNLPNHLPSQFSHLDACAHCCHCHIGAMPLIPDEYCGPCRAINCSYWGDY